MPQFDDAALKALSQEMDQVVHDPEQMRLLQKKIRELAMDLNVNKQYVPHLQGLIARAQYYLDKTKLLSACQCLPRFQPKDPAYIKGRFFHTLLEFAESLRPDLKSQGRPITLMSVGSGQLRDEYEISHRLMNHGFHVQWILIDPLLSQEPEMEHVVKAFENLTTRPDRSCKIVGKFSFLGSLYAAVLRNESPAVDLTIDPRKIGSAIRRWIRTIFVQHDFFIPRRIGARLTAELQVYQEFQAHPQIATFQPDIMYCIDVPGLQPEPLLSELFKIYKQAAYDRFFMLDHYQRDILPRGIPMVDTDPEPFRDESLECLSVVAQPLLRDRLWMELQQQLNETYRNHSYFNQKTEHRVSVNTFIADALPKIECYLTSNLPESGWTSQEAEALKAYILTLGSEHFKRNHRALRILLDILLVILFPVGAVVAGIRAYKGNPVFFSSQLPTQRQRILEASFNSDPEAPSGYPWRFGFLPEASDRPSQRNTTCPDNAFLPRCLNAPARVE